MPKMKPGKDQGNAALPKLGSPWTSKHSQDLLKYNAVDDHAAHPMSMRGPLDKNHPMKKYGDPMKDQSPLPMSPLNEHGDPDTPHSEKKKEAKPLTEKQKYRMAATAVGEDASFTLKTFDDPRSGRLIVETKRALKKKNPGLYQDLYGK